MTGVTLTSCQGVPKRSKEMPQTTDLEVLHFTEAHGPTSVGPLHLSLHLERVGEPLSHQAGKEG